MGSLIFLRNYRTQSRKQGNFPQKRTFHSENGWRSNQKNLIPERIRALAQKVD